MSARKLPGGYSKKLGYYLLTQNISKGTRHNTPFTRILHPTGLPLLPLSSPLSLASSRPAPLNKMAGKLALLAVAFSVMIATSSAFGGLRKLQQVSSDESWTIEQ